MAAKKNLRLGVKPLAQGMSTAAEADTWIENRHGHDLEVPAPNAVPTPPTEPQSSAKLKRITFEVSEEKHQRIKVYAASKGMSIKELMLALIDKELQM